MLKRLKLALFETSNENSMKKLIVREVSKLDETAFLSIRNHPDNYKWFFTKLSFWHYYFYYNLI